MPSYNEILFYRFPPQSVRVGAQCWLIQLSLARLATGRHAGPVDCATTVLLVCFAFAVCMCCACTVNVLQMCCKSLTKEAQENLKSELVVARTAYILH